MTPTVSPRARFLPSPGFATCLAASLLAACGGGQGATPEFQVRGMSIVVDSPAPFTTRPDFPQRVESTLDVALRYWGGSWSDLQGFTVVFDGEQHVICDGKPNAIGCFQGEEIRVSTRDVGFTFTCVEATVLVHEVGHAVIGDPDHADPRWMDFSSVVKDLEGRRGYDASGDAPCPIVVGMWRHPAPSPGT